MQGCIIELPSRRTFALTIFPNVNLACSHFPLEDPLHPRSDPLQTLGGGGGNHRSLDVRAFTDAEHGRFEATFDDLFVSKFRASGTLHLHRY